MNTQKQIQPMRKLKIIPGRGLTGIDIKKRLRNRTLEGQVFGDDQYTMNEDMDLFMKMSRVEQINHVRKNNIKIKKLQNILEQETDDKKRKQQEQNIENEIQKRIKEIGQQQSNNLNLTKEIGQQQSNNLNLTK